ncbi:hypothetical protein D9M68_786650 [compost metagenome]
MPDYPAQSLPDTNRSVVELSPDFLTLHLDRHVQIEDLEAVPDQQGDAGAGEEPEVVVLPGQVEEDDGRGQVVGEIKGVHPDRIGSTALPEYQTEAVDVLQITDGKSESADPKQVGLGAVRIDQFLDHRNPLLNYCCQCRCYVAPCGASQGPSEPWRER